MHEAQQKDGMSMNKIAAGRQKSYIDGCVTTLSIYGIS